jgi:hypothetical protein
MVVGVSLITMESDGRSSPGAGAARIDHSAEMTRLARRRAPGAPAAIDTTGPQFRGTPGAPEPLASLGQFYPDAELAALASQAGLQDVQVRNDGGGQVLTARS